MLFLHRPALVLQYLGLVLLVKLQIALCAYHCHRLGSVLFKPVVLIALRANSHSLELVEDLALNRVHEVDLGSVFGHINFGNDEARLGVIFREFLLLIVQQDSIQSFVMELGQTGTQKQSGFFEIFKVYDFPCFWHACCMLIHIYRCEK